MKWRKISCLAILFCCLNNLAASDQNSDQLTESAWQALANNDQRLAEQHFHEAITADKNNSRAYLGLSYLYNMQLKYEPAWEAYSQALQIVGDRYPYLFAAWATNIMRGNDFVMNAFHEKLLLKLSKQADDNGILKAMAHSELGTFYHNRGELSKAKKHHENMNTITEWTVIGPFENISASGFNNVFPPELEYDATKTYVGKNGVPVQWFKIAAIRDNYWIDCKRYFAFTSSVFYGNTFVYSSQNQTAQIRIGTSGSLKAFLNDEQLIEEFDETNNDLDTYIVETQLQKGWNRLLIKCGYSEINECNFMVRITDPRGEVIDGLKVSTEPNSYEHAPGAQVKRIPNFAESYFEHQIEQHPQHPENYLLLADCYLRNDKAIEAELTLRDALKLSPNCALLQHHLLEAYLRGEKYDEYATTMEKIYALDKHIPSVLQHKIEKYLDNENVDEAEKTLKQLEQLLPESEIVYQLYLELYELKGQSEKLIETTSQAYEKYPTNWTFAYLEAFISIQKTKKYDGAIEIFERFVKQKYTTTALLTLAGFYLQAGNIAKWQETYQRLLERDPAATGIYYKMSTTRFAMQDYAHAEEEILKAIEICPNSPQYWAQLGEIHRVKNKIAPAKQAYRTALDYQPTHYEARDKLRELEGKPPIFSHFESADIDSLTAIAPDKTDYPEDDAVVLLRSSKNVVYGRGASESVEELLVKVFGNGGIEDFKERWILYNPYSQELIIEKAVVMKNDGAEIKADININHIVFKSLEANDVVYMKWRLKNAYSGKLAQHFWDSFYFNGYYPYQIVRYALLAPEEFVFHYKLQNLELEPQIKSTPDGRLYIWSMQEEPGIKYEYYMPGQEDVGKMLHLSSIDDWSFLADWYSDLARTKNRSSFEIKEMVQELFSENKDYSEEDKIRIIYNFISEKIQYSSLSFRQSKFIPQKARDVLVSKLGDCKDVATLFIAMLKEVGIQAYYVLLNTRDEGRNEFVLPAVAFNHVVVAVETKNGVRYFDPTARNYPAGSLPEMDVGAFSLLVKSGVKKPEYLSDSHLMPDNIFRETKAEIKKDNSLSVQRHTSRMGTLGASMRYYYRDKGQKEREKMLTETLSQTFPNVKLLSLEFKNLDNLEREVTCMYHFEAPGHVKQSGQFLILQIPWSDALESDPALAYKKRDYIYNYWPWADTLVENIEIKLPTGPQPLDLPKDFSTTCSIADYSISYSVSNDILKAKRMFVNKKQVVRPDEYVEFKNFYSDVMKEDTRQILLKK